MFTIYLFIYSFTCVFTFRDFVISSAKFYISDFSNVETSSLKNMLKRTDSKMASWRSPGISP